MRNKVLNDNLITEIIEKVEASDKKDTIYKYIAEVAENCAKLCKKGENLRVLNEYKLLIDNLRKEFDL